MPDLKKKIVVVFQENADIISKYNPMHTVFSRMDFFFPKDSILFMMDYPGSGMNHAFRPLITIKMALELYKKAVDEYIKNPEMQLWVFCRSIGMAVFSSIFKKIREERLPFPYAIVSLAGVMDIHSTLRHLSNNIFLGLRSVVYNTKYNIQKYMPPRWTTKESQLLTNFTKIYWVLCEEDRIIDNRFVIESIGELRRAGYDIRYVVIPGAHHHDILGYRYLIGSVQALYLDECIDEFILHYEYTKEDLYELYHRFYTYVKNTRYPMSDRGIYYCKNMQRQLLHNVKDIPLIINLFCDYVNTVIEKSSITTYGVLDLVFDH